MTHPFEVLASLNSARFGNPSGAPLALPATTSDQKDVVAVSA